MGTEALAYGEEVPKDLFEQILIAPAKESPGGRLLIVSGYASANMADRHMSVLRKEGLNISVSLIVGMARSHGIKKAQHLAFKKLIEENPYRIDFECLYTYQGNPVHAKTYLWIGNDGSLRRAFCGSANYTMTGFSRRQIEAMSPMNPVSAKTFYTRIHQLSASCLEDTIDEVVPLIRSADPTEQEESVTLPLLITRTGETHKRAGLNWGQRPSRDPDQAYIPVPSNIQRSGFFPRRGEQFTVLTDDGYSFIFVRAQDSGKALETTLDNSELGAYLRQRIGVDSGEYVTRQHLLDYGRIDVEFIKIDSETYIMDFRPNLDPGVDR